MLGEFSPITIVPGGQGWTLAGGWRHVPAGNFRAFVAVSRDRSIYAVAIRGAVNLFEPAVCQRWLLALDLAQTDWLFNYIAGQTGHSGAAAPG